MFGNLGHMSKTVEGIQESAKKLQSELGSKVFSVKNRGANPFGGK